MERPFEFLEGWLTSARNGVDSWAVVLHNGSGAAFHRQDAGHLENDVLRGGPAGKAACQLHTNHLGVKTQ